MALPAPKESSSIVVSYYEHRDASLTATGWKQVDELGKRFSVSGMKDGTELVVVSPLTRTLQTASGVLGGGKYSEGEYLPPLMMDNVGRCPRPAISSSSAPPFVASDLCREHLNIMPCDWRNPVSKTQPLFPGIDFSKIEEDQDREWSPEARESEEKLDRRTLAFLNFLDVTPEKEITVVSHGGFLTNMLKKFADETVNSSMFDNCELRTVKMRKMISPDSKAYTFQLSAA